LPAPPCKNPRTSAAWRRVTCPVSLDYFDRRPFQFDGKISNVEIELAGAKVKKKVA
jgi:hypothetical protein